MDEKDKKDKKRKQEKKKVQQWVILLVLLAIMVGYYYWLKKSKPTEKEKEQQREKEILKENIILNKELDILPSYLSSAEHLLYYDEFYFLKNYDQGFNSVVTYLGNEISYFGKKSSKIEDYGFQKTIQEYNRDLFRILGSKGIEFRKMKYKAKKVRGFSYETFSIFSLYDDGNYFSGFYETYNNLETEILLPEIFRGLDHIFIYFSFEESLGFCLNFHDGRNDNGTIKVIPFSNLYIRRFDSRVYFCCLDNFSSLLGSEKLDIKFAFALSMGDVKNSTLLFKYFDYFVSKVKALK